MLTTHLDVPRVEMRMALRPPLVCLLAIALRVRTPTRLFHDDTPTDNLVG
jgi:hypothetical protein